MGQRIQCCDPVCFVDLDHSDEEVFGIVGDSMKVWMAQVKLPSDDVIADGVSIQEAVLPCEWNDTREHYVQDNTQTPHVSRNAVRLALEDDLWRAKKQGSISLATPLISEKELGEAEIYYDRSVDHTYRSWIRHYKYVFQFEISVSYTSRMKVYYGSNQLMNQ